MIKPGLTFLLIIYVSIVFAQNDSTQYELKIFYGSEDNRSSFCSDSVKAAPFIKIEGDGFDEDKEGIRISIANYKRDEDFIVYHGNQKFDVVWNSSYGYLEITGIGSAQEYQEAARAVYYKNTAPIPNLDDRYISVTLKDADYLPETQHFYRFIKKQDITWTSARDSASKMSYNGLQGYLGTITSSVENDFIWTKIDGIGWIGATDEEVEGTWKWVTGPEAGVHFWQGTYNNGYAVNGRFSYWSEGEPNNAHGETNNGIGEDYGHVNQNPEKRIKSWNDLRNNGDGTNSQYYRPQGFIVEFGGMPGDPELQLSATSIIEIQKIAFSEKREYEVCRGESVRLNDIELPAANNYNYSWRPDENISGVNVHNPSVSPVKNKTFTAVGELNGCVSEAIFKVQVNPLPESLLEPEYIICKGSSVVLNPGEHQSYIWSSGEKKQTISVKEEGAFSVLLTNEFGCKINSETNLEFSKRPVLNYESIDPLVCGSKQQRLKLKFDTGTAATVLMPLQGNSLVSDESTLSPTVAVDKFGKYSFKMDIADSAGCTYADTIDIEFHNQPDAQFQIDEVKCAGYNLKLDYQGQTFEDALFNWYSNDTLFSSGLNESAIEVPLGYGTINRSVGLQINEHGCVDSLNIPVTVKPILDFWAEQSEGCTPLNVQFNYSASESVDKFYWAFGDGNISKIEKPKHLYKNKGTTDHNLDVSLRIVSSEGCENTGTVKDLITVHPIPTIDFDFFEDECYNELAVVNYEGSASGNANFLWDLSDFETDEIISAPGNLAGPLEFKRSSKPTVDIGLQVVSEFGCKTDSVLKTWKRNPVFDFETEISEGCPPLEVGFTVATADGFDDVNYFWDFNDGNVASGEVVSNIYLKPESKYQVKLVAISNLTGCTDTFFLPEKIAVFSQPIALFEPEPNSVLISHPVVQFENQSSNASHYEWDFDDDIFSSEQSPIHRFSDMGFYDVMLTALNDHGCADTTSREVTVAFDRIFPPNAFSPNANLKEDREFRIHSEGIASKGYQLLIFNRWGETIFESKRQDSGWDGKMRNGNFAPAGVYTWIIHYKDFQNKNHKQQGTVTLLF